MFTLWYLYFGYEELKTNQKIASWDIKHLKFGTKATTSQSSSPAKPTDAEQQNETKTAPSPKSPTQVSEFKCELRPEVPPPKPPPSPDAKIEIKPPPMTQLRGKSPPSISPSPPPRKGRLGAQNNYRPPTPTAARLSPSPPSSAPSTPSPPPILKKMPSPPLSKGKMQRFIDGEREAQSKQEEFRSETFINIASGGNPTKRSDNLLSRANTKMVDAAVLEKLEAGFKKLESSDSKSLLKKYLTREVFDKLKTQKTPTFGSTLLDVIQSGVENLDSGVGIYAPDAEAYTVFADLFDPIIEDYHSGFKKTDKHPAKDWGDVDTLANLDPTGEFIISTRVRCGRSMEGYPFNPCLTEAQYKEMEEKVSSTLSGLTGELKGQFYPLTGMTKEVQQKLIDDHFLFKEGDRFLQAANACRFWPTGRGIYHNENKTFLVWCNEEDHLRLISMQMGGDLGQVYRRLVTAVNDIEKRIPFSHHDRLGFLTFCPTNLGTTVRASVHIKVPKLAANRAKLEEVAGKFNLQVRGTRGEHTEAEGGVYDISNKRRMGLTEYQAVKEMNDGIAELIKIEREL